MRLGHRCNSGPHALEWNVDCSKISCEDFMQDITLGGEHFFAMVNMCETEVLQITSF